MMKGSCEEREIILNNKGGIGRVCGINMDVGEVREEEIRRRMAWTEKICLGFHTDVP